MAALFLIFLLSAPAEASETLHTCGSSVAVDREARNVADIVRAKGIRRALNAPKSRIENDYVIVPTDEAVLPFDDPADLEGVTLYFKRRNTTTFAASREPFTYDDSVRDLLVSFGRGANVKTFTLSKFKFPFGDMTYDSLAFSSTRGIHFTHAPEIPSRPFVPFEMLTSRMPLIAPLYDYSGSPAGRPDVLYKETKDALTVTWRMQSPGVVDYEYQAVLFATGDIRFSYKRVRNIAWGGVVLTTGNPDAWLSQRQALAIVTDSTGDVDPEFGESRGMLDIVAAHVSRVSKSTMLELRIDVAQPIDRKKLDAKTSYIFFVGDSVNRVQLFVRGEELLYRVPQAGDLENPLSARIIGSSIFMNVSEEMLVLGPREVKVWAYSGTTSPADSVSTMVDLGPATERAETDFSEVTALETSKPFVEHFRLPSVNLQGVWERVKSDLRYEEGEIDAVMVYTPFLTDIVQKPYAAFAMLSNAGADGISNFSSTSRAKDTMLVNMNHLNAFSNYGTQVLLHEFGHRWLYYFDIFEDGATTRSLNPLGYHPAQYVHTPAAFNVKTGADSSTMGGAVFVEHDSSSFRSPQMGQSPAGYSWHELYLMGLAAPEEVAPWWYIRDADPALGLEYYPPANVTVKGKRVDVSVQQIISAMGPRVPAYRDSDKSFRVLFVVLERPGQRVSAIAPEYRLQFESAFAKATGGRGRVVTAARTNGKRRAAR